MLLPRLITAIIGIPLVALTVYWGGVPFLVLMFGVVFLSLREFFFLAGHGKYNAQPVLGIITGLILLVSIFLNGTALGAAGENQGTAAMLTLLLIPLYAREMMRKPLDRAIERISITFFGSFFIAWTLGHLLLLRNLQPAGMGYVYFLIGVIWLLDTGAYAVGIRFGKRKLAETVSPKKTIEGALGGTIVSVLAALLCRLLFLRENITPLEAVIAGLFIALIAQFSDLSESLLKRDVGVKDSANLLPGHGGMLDRFDSFLFTAPLFYYYLTIFKHS
ncbi:MAG: hypothetical protein A2219_05540 [Elusimicrobia bacterium RIFOXYA2_FULL_50_26]|nr:MAG: hypothetical protein A2219_05540 [Elusimicrobia bacterium RIFOXYA2_FULL_50_26]OGS24410.1 MAG: hypothetical protein A2314_04245 [Elusimicrobia bacterium RIFOXYB2_FULL_50_12]